MLRDLNVETLTVAGTSQTTATAILAIWSPALILAAGDSVAGISLPRASKGRVFEVKNTGPLGGLGGLNVYPAVGDSINALAANAPLVMDARTAARFVATSATVWETLPNVPS